MQTLGQRLQYYRKKKGFSKTEVAVRLGIKPDNYKHIENGNRNPKQGRINELAAILGVEAYKLNNSVVEQYQQFLSQRLLEIVTGDECGMQMLHEICQDDVADALREVLDKWAGKIETQYPQFWARYMDAPDLHTLRELVAAQMIAQMSYVEGIPTVLEDLADDPQADKHKSPKGEAFEMGDETFQTIPNAPRSLADPVPAYILLSVVYCKLIYDLAESASPESIILHVAHAYDLATEDQTYEDLDFGQVYKAIVNFGAWYLAPFVKILSSPLELVNGFGTPDDLEQAFICEDF